MDAITPTEISNGEGTARTRAGMNLSTVHGVCVCGIALVKPIGLCSGLALEIYQREHGEGRRDGSVGNTVTQKYIRERERGEGRRGGSVGNTVTHRRNSAIFSCHHCLVSSLLLPNPGYFPT